MLRHFKVRTRLIAGFMFLSILGAVIAGIGIYDMAKMHDQEDAMYKLELMGLSYIKEANIDLIYLGRARGNCARQSRCKRLCGRGEFRMKSLPLALVPVFLLVACGKTPGSDTVEMKNASIAEVQDATKAVTALNPGAWTTTSEIVNVELPSIEGQDPQMAEAMIGSMKGRKTSTTTCLTPEQAKSPNAGLIGGKEGGQCSFESFSLSHGTLDSVMSCHKEGEAARMVIATHGSYSGDEVALDAVMRVDTAERIEKVEKGEKTEAAQTLRLHARITGKRTGACEAPQTAPKGARK